MPPISKTPAKNCAQTNEGSLLKRYLVFIGDHYYPSGGWEDYVGTFDTYAEALTASRAPQAGYLSPSDWSQIIDTHTLEKA